jgi:hypothetical protein
MTEIVDFRDFVMSARDNETLETPAADGEFIWPRPVAGLRSLTREELERLETALEKSVDREDLEHWVTTSISNAVKLSSLPSPVRARDGLKKLATEGRKWIDEVESDPIKALLEQKVLQDHKDRPDALLQHRTKIEELKAKMAQICVQADSAAVEVGLLIKRGGQRSTPPALIAFLQNMIGIAKWNGIRPSTPQRYMHSKKPPAFFVFVEKALATAEDVIVSSSIPNPQKRRAVQSLQYASTDALIRILERKRGLIGDYHDSPYGGLIQDTGRQRRTRQGRKRRG